MNPGDAVMLNDGSTVYASVEKEQGKCIGCCIGDNPRCGWSRNGIGAHAHFIFVRSHEEAIVNSVTHRLTEN